MAKTMNPVRTLRETLGITQRKFALLIGATVDTVKSWECGRNEVSTQFRQRIWAATGAKLNQSRPTYWKNKKPYQRCHFDDWKKHLGEIGEEMVNTYSGQAMFEVSILFLCALKVGKINYRLPALWASFSQWANKAVEEFGLEREVLKHRKICVSESILSKPGMNIPLVKGL